MSTHPQPPFADFIGMTITHLTPEGAKGELLATEANSNRFGSLHGGAIMSLADTLGGMSTLIGMPKGFTTTTIESKTNFLAAIPVGNTARGECTPLHRGRTTMVWQTKITRDDGKLAAVVTQTQLVIPPKNS
jgi:uncharacterized protein (TIGR00369 family)